MHTVIGAVYDISVLRNVYSLCDSISSAAFSYAGRRSWSSMVVYRVMSISSCRYCRNDGDPGEFLYFMYIWAYQLLTQQMIYQGLCLDYLLGMRVPDVMDWRIPDILYLTRIHTYYGFISAWWRSKAMGR